jgi:hypothetical protein
MANEIDDPGLSTSQFESRRFPKTAPLDAVHHRSGRQPLACLNRSFETWSWSRQTL